MRNVYHQEWGGVCSAALLVLLLFVGATPSWAGPVLLSGQTPDVAMVYTQDPYKGSIAETYSLLFANLYHQVTNGQTKVLAIGNIGDLFIYDLIHDVTPVTVDRVAGLAVATVDFSAYAVIYIPSSDAYNFYGLTTSESATLVSRAADIAGFVNSGGGLFSLAQSPYLSDPYGFLSGLGGVVHYDNGTNYGGYSAITPTPAGVALGSAAGFDLNNLNYPGDICPVPFPCGNLWGYDVYTAYPSFYQSLATVNSPSQPWYDGIAAILYGNTAATGADLSVTKADSPDPVTVGNNLTYTVTVSNGGPNDATGVSLADTLPAGVTYVSAFPSQGTCSEAGGVVSCAIGDLAAGGSATVSIVVTPTAAGMISNTVSVAGNETDPNLTNNTATASTTVNAAGADLSVIKTDSPDPVAVGSNLTYMITVTNNGPDAATGVRLTDRLPIGVIFVSATPSQGTCTGTSRVTCSLGTLANGATATVMIVVQPTAAGTLRNTASVTSTTTDPNSANNRSTARTTVQ